ncbi:aminoglycoside phosphotransferase [Streptomyces albofaciens JCM 4342]|uniref:phosphotransferase n=1 Tax=Streptomyces albofaciens TaxID=66866 RepID=UPI0012387F09|nr:phosphotransferase [Streptomyces albofaciens]KAA6223666.1 aminoglycoside phosphotransferase [Streptomyces albofaciens JCM 4342]
MSRTGWWELPAGVWAAVEERTGPVAGARDVADGLTCSTAAVLTTASGPVFMKGVPAGDARGRAAQAMEAAVNAAVLGVGPRLLWRVVAGGWDLLGFEYVEGRHADLSTGSADLALVAGVLRAAQAVRAPEGVPSFADRFAEVLPPGQLELLRGDSLLHTDTNPHNLLVGDGRAWLVDWAMPAAGPAWVDVAYTTVRLMEADCPPGEALEWAAQFPAWAAADPRAVGAFVAGACRLWERQVGARDARPSNGRFTVLGMAA